VVRAVPLRLMMVSGMVLCSGCTARGSAFVAEGTEVHPAWVVAETCLWITVDCSLQALALMLTSR
jgi:hypothetical protein